jgi:MSHA biogenesis protein MshQ
VASPTLVAEDQAAAHQGCDLASRLGSLPGAQWVAGVHAFNDANADNLPDTASASFSRPAVPLSLTAATCAANRSSAGGPFWLLDIGVAINDADVAAGLSGNDMNAASTGVCAGAACTARKVGTTAAVYGRLWFNSAYGSEMLPLAVPVLAQYWTAAGWLRNVNDSCSPLTQPTRQDTGNGGLMFYANSARNALAPGEVVAQMGGSTASSVNLSAGDARLVLRHPGSSTQGPGDGNFGYVDVMGAKLSPGSWLPPSANARACFGACGPRSPVIYLRESY